MTDAAFALSLLFAFGLGTVLGLNIAGFTYRTGVANLEAGAAAYRNALAAREQASQNLKDALAAREQALTARKVAAAARDEIVRLCIEKSEKLLASKPTPDVA